MTPSKQAAYLGIKYFGMAMCGYDEEPSGSALRLAADIDKALDQVRAEERARSAKLVQALEKIHGWHWQHNSPAELKRWADEALESYRAELETKVPLI